MIEKLVKKNIFRNRIRAFLIVCPIALIVMLFISISSILAGVDEKIYEKYESNADRTVLPVFMNTTSDNSTYYRLSSILGVQGSQKSYLGAAQFRNENIFIKKVQYPDEAGYEIVQGSFFNKTGQAIVDEVFAFSRAINVNETVEIEGKNYFVTGTFNSKSGVLAQIVMLDSLDEYNLVELSTSRRTFYAVEEQAKSMGFETLRGGSVSSYFRTSTMLLSKSLSQILIVISIIVLFSLFNIINITVYERRKDIRLLLNIGMAENHVLLSLVLEIMFLALFGFAVGYFLGKYLPLFMMLAFALATRTSPILPVVDSSIIIRSFIITLSIGLLTALYTGYKASRLSFEKEEMCI
jgi:ABC-type antimicrobial peptide transport system permease subunit